MQSSSYALAKDQIIQKYRLILLAAGFLYPLWRHLFHIAVPNANDELWQRMALGGAFIFIAILSYFFTHFKNNLPLYFDLCFYSCILHVGYLIHQNDLNLSYILSGFVIMYSTGASFLNSRSLRNYYSLAWLATALILLLEPTSARLIFFISCCVAIIASYLSQRGYLLLLFEVSDREAKLKRKTDDYLELSGAVQNLFLPSSPNFKNSQIELSGYYRPVDKCGGDWWWYKLTDQKKLHVIVGDVTGHGPGPAMITASVASYFRVIENLESAKQQNIDQNADQNVGQNDRHNNDPKNGQNLNLGGILHAVNDQILNTLAIEKDSRDSLMTLSAIEIDLNKMQLQIWHAGAPFVYIVSNSDQIVSLGQPGTHFITRNFAPAVQIHQLLPGDRIFMFTDGITETMARQRQFGERRLLKVLRAAQDLPCDSTCEHLIEQIDSFRGTNEQDDDYTFVVIDILPRQKRTATNAA